MTYLAEYIVGHLWITLGFWVVGCAVLGFASGFAQGFVEALVGELRREDSL